MKKSSWWRKDLTLYVQVYVESDTWQLLSVIVSWVLSKTMCLVILVRNIHTVMKASCEGRHALPGGQPLQWQRGRAVAAGSPVAGSLSLAWQSVVADMNCVFSHIMCFCLIVDPSGLSWINIYIVKNNQFILSCQNYLPMAQSACFTWYFFLFQSWASSQQISSVVSVIGVLTRGGP